MLAAHAIVHQTLVLVRLTRQFTKVSSGDVCRRHDEAVTVMSVSAPERYEGVVDTFVR
jgi:hypothetical protein